MSESKFHFLPGLFVFILILSASLLHSNESKEWIGSYSSQEWEGGISYGKKEETKAYYQWQIDSLKRSVPPRYIRLLDIHEYAKSGKILNKGILFTYSGIHKKKVLLCGNFFQWKCESMRKNRFGIFYYLHPPSNRDKNYNSLTKYQYKFKVDGLYVEDPTNPAKFVEDMDNSFSTYVLYERDVNKFATAKILEDSELEEENLRTVKFQLYLPENDTVAIIGDFNNWNYESDYLTKKQNGNFEITMKLTPGTYYYKFIVDGKRTTDLYNPNVKLREPYNELVSELKVPKRNQPLERKN